MKSSNALVDEVLLSRIEDAGINASAPPEQRWLDGWLVRFSPGKAKRARCVNALAPGRLPLDERLRQASAVFVGAGLPMVVRITPFSSPQDLDRELELRGYGMLDDTRVMVRPRWPDCQEPEPDLPAETEWVPLDPDGFAEAVGELRGSPNGQRLAHARRLRLSPVQYLGYAIRRRHGGQVLACGQFAAEGEFVGLYDIFTSESDRGRGLATLVCERLLRHAGSRGARIAYLQVEAHNLPARHVYGQLGFSDAYAYHYRTAPPGI